MHKTSRGFTLLELSITLAIAGLVLGGGTLTAMALLERQARETTEQRLDTIQKALLEYATAYGYLPCPADITDTPGSPSFGNALGSGSPAPGGCGSANYSHPNGSGQITREGLVPTKQLSLPDDLAMDGYGYRFFYLVSEHMTAANALVDYPVNAANAGTITVLDDFGVPRAGLAVYALISPGSNGHGAFPQDSGTARHNGGSLDMGELENCDWDAGSNTTSFNETVVQKRITSTFDDLVRFLKRGDLGSRS